MRKHVLVVAIVVTLVVAATASAGGWATVQLSSTPNGVKAGVPWNVRITVLQHGIRPLAGLAPRVLIRKGAVSRSFPARPAGKPGLYRARVVFPSAGTWTWRIDDGFTQVHDYFPVTIATR